MKWNFFNILYLFTLCWPALLVKAVDDDHAPNALLAGSGQNSSAYYLYVLSSGSLESPTRVADYPLSVYLEMASTLDDQTVVCGGYDQRTEALTDACFKLDVDVMEWERVATLNKPLYYGTAVTLDEEHVWITGGVEDFEANEPVNNTWIVNIQDGSITAGPSLPLRLDNHCALMVNESHTVLAYGYSGESGSSKKAFIYDWEEDQWSELPDSIDRTGPACGLITDNKGQKTLVATSGWSYAASDYTQDTALLTLDVDSGWRAGPPYPLKSYTMRAMVVENQMYVMGGSALQGPIDNVLRLDLENNEWVELEQGLVEANFGHVATSIHLH